MSSVLTEINGPIVTVSLNRPDAMNAMDFEMARDLFKTAVSLGNDPSVRAIIITGVGDKCFCAGGDLAAFDKHAEIIGRHIDEMALYLHGAISIFSQIDAPVITAINGVTAGAGLAFLGFPQIVIAARSASFVSAYTKAGLSPDGSSTWYLPRILGMRRAQEFIFTNRVLSATEALEWGLVNVVADGSDLLDEANKTANKLAAGPRVVHGRVKDLLNSSFDSSLEVQMAKEARYLSQSARSVDGQTGIRSFLNKSNANFTE